LKSSYQNKKKAQKKGGAHPGAIKIRQLGRGDPQKSPSPLPKRSKPDENRARDEGAEVSRKRERSPKGPNFRTRNFGYPHESEKAR